MGSGPLAFLEGANNFSTITKNTGKRFWGVGAVLGVWGRGGGKGRMSIKMMRKAIKGHTCRLMTLNSYLWHVV
jgi:hypothetical protein